MRRKIHNHKPIVSRTTRSAILTAPTKTSILNNCLSIKKFIYFQSISE